MRHPCTGNYVFLAYFLFIALYFSSKFMPFYQSYHFFRFCCLLLQFCLLFRVFYKLLVVLLCFSHHSYQVIICCRWCDYVLVYQWCCMYFYTDFSFRREKCFLFAVKQFHLRPAIMHASLMICCLPRCWW